VDGTPLDSLQQGIVAAKAGRAETARSLLTQVVEQDEHNATAWLWLSGVVDSLDDREVCLENVLTLDPENQAARRGLEWVREQKAATPPAYTPPLLSESLASSTGPALTPAAAMFRKKPPEPAPSLSPVETPSARPLVDAWVAPPQKAQEEMEARLAEFDDEYLCPYCAEPTKPEDKMCKACKGKLWRSSRKKPQPSSLFWILLGYLLFDFAGTLFLCGLIGQVLLGRFFQTGKVKTVEQLLGVYLGIQTLPPDVAAEMTKRLPPLLFWIMVAILSIQLIQIVLIYLRWQPMYWFLVGLACFNTLLALGGAALAPGTGTIVNLGLTFLPVVFLLRIAEDFMMEHERLLCAPDPSIHTHSAFYMRGREYARQNMWALAAIHFRRSTAGAPNMLGYHLALAQAYARLKRYGRAESVLQDARRLAPDTPEVRELTALIATTRALAPGAKRSTA